MMSKITRIETQKKAPGRVNIYIDGEYAAGFSAKLLVDLGLYVGKEVDPSAASSWIEADDYVKCLDKAYNYLSYRPRSEKEMREKLQEKYSPEISQKVIERLQEYNLINDFEFAKSWIASRQKGKGKRALEMELNKKGISKDIRAELLSKIEQTDEYGAALALVRAKSKYRELNRVEAYKKVAPFLSRRGYCYDTVRRVIDELFEK